MKKSVIKLTAKEEEVMTHFWQRGALFVRELLESYDEPKPHFNTLSTVVRGLEEKGCLSHRSYGSSYQYFATISLDEFRAQSLQGLIGKYYDNSIFSAVSALVETKAISSEQLRELLTLVEKGEEQ
ncbi:MAG: BlaI/MecI/CopY family transcriptional regulator [Rikenellaceae bacterium]